MDSKQELLSQMYTLRAGMSWLSQKKQQIDRLNNAVKVPEEVTEEKVLGEAKERVLSLENQLRETKAEEKEDFRKIISNSGSTVGAYIFCTVCSIIGVIVAIALFFWGYNLMLQDKTIGMWIVFILGGIFALAGILCIYISILFTSYPDRLWLSMFSAVICFVIAVGCSIGGYVFLLRENVFTEGVLFALSALFFVIAVVRTILYAVHKHIIEKHYRIYNKKIKQVKNAIADATQRVEYERKNIFPNVKAQNEAEIAEARRKIKEIRETQIKPLAELCNDFYDTLSATFGGMLDVRDWQYIDLVIYYIETNRAESIREALQQVDSERQTQQIVTSMRMATEQICHAIKFEMRALGRSIEHGFSNLERSISNLENNFSSKIASLQKSVENSAAQTRLLASAQITQASLTNALLEKSNSTGEQLMNDVHYLRERLY